MRKLFISILFVLFAMTVVTGRDNKRLGQPNHIVRATTAEFTGDDSTYTTHFDNGRVIHAKGFYVAGGVSDSGYIIFQPKDNYNEMRFPYKVRTSDIGVPIPFMFNKIYRTGTTIPLDSIYPILDY